MSCRPSATLFGGSEPTSARDKVRLPGRPTGDEWAQTRGGVAWRLLPTDLPPRTTVYRWFARWRDTGVFERINHLLVMADRERVGREACPAPP